jgi:hypothetical protein
MHDDTPVHFSRAMRDVLNNTYHDPWIGTGGPTAWPPYSPELNLLKFYLWRHLKPLMYVAPVDNEEALRIVDAYRTIRSYLGIFERMQRSMMRHVEACFERHGEYFEYLLLMYSFSCNSKMKCFRKHVDKNICSCFGSETRAQSLSAPFSYTL